jgi:protoporphyrinogen oxidase
MAYSSVHVVGVGLRGEIPERLREISWLYFPGPETPFHRVTVLSNYSPYNVPEGSGFWSLMAEVCESPMRPVNAGTLVRRTVAALLRTGLLPRGTRVVSRWHRREERGYPTPLLIREQVLAAVLPALERHRVYSRGRFGLWRYEVSNQDHCFMQGVELVNRLLGLGEEITIHRPDMANRTRRRRASTT